MGRLGRLVVVAAVVASTAVATPALGRVRFQNAPVLDLQSLRELLTRVPTNFRESCQVLDDVGTFTDFADGVDAALTCSADGVDVVQYLHFTDDDALNGAYSLYLRANDEDYVEVDPESGCETFGTWSRDGVDLGRYVCVQLEPSEPDTAPVGWVWTEDDARILAYAARSEDFSALRSFWLDAGPNEAEPLGFPADLDAARDRRLGRSVLKSIPGVARRFCQIADVGDPEQLGILAPYRVWIRASVSCRPTRGAAVANYHLFGDQTVLATAYGELGPANVDERRNENCEHSSTYRRHNRVVGGVTCYFSGDQGERAALLWTYKPKTILALAVRGDDRSDILLDFWRGAGPVG